jgi:predicted GIY-YIG superfamily endonuclease
MTWYVYIVQCSDGSLYTGIAKNVQKRIGQHNKGRGAKYTRSRLPVVLKAQWPASSQSQALKEEYRIKGLSRSEKLRIIDGMKVSNSVVLKNPHLAFKHARDVIGGRWPEAEIVIAQYAGWSYFYAEEVIKGRFNLAEEVISKDPEWACCYAMDVIQGRWPEVEETIAGSKYKSKYLERFPSAKEDWAANGWLDWLDT